MHCLCLLTPWLAKKSLEMPHEDAFLWPRLPLCSKDISRQHPQAVSGKQQCSPFLHLAEGVTLGFLQKGKVPGSSVLLKSYAKGGMEAEQQDLWKTGLSHLAWSRHCSLERSWDTASCLARNTTVFSQHQTASPGVLQPTYRRTESTGSCISKSGINEPSFTEG